MKVKISHDTVADGKPVNAGRIIEVSESEGKALILEKKAKPFDAPEEEPEEMVVEDEQEPSIKAKAEKKSK